MSTANPVPARMTRLPRHRTSHSRRRRHLIRPHRCGCVPRRLGHGSGHGLDEGSRSRGDSAHTWLLSERSTKHPWTATFSWPRTSSRLRSGCVSQIASRKQACWIRKLRRHYCPLARPRLRL